MTGAGMQERPERFASSSNPSLLSFCCQKAGVRGRGEGEVQRSSRPVSGRKGDASACNTSWLVSLRGRPPGWKKAFTC